MVYFFSKHISQHAVSICVGIFVEVQFQGRDQQQLWSSLHHSLNSFHGLGAMTVNAPPPCPLCACMYVCMHDPKTVNRGPRLGYVLVVDSRGCQSRIAGTTQSSVGNSINFTHEGLGFFFFFFFSFSCHACKNARIKASAV